MAWLSLMMVMITGTYSVPQYTSDNRKVEAYMGQDVTLTFESSITPAELITEVTIVQQRVNVKRILYHCLRKKTRNPCINYFSNIEGWSSNNFTVFHIAIKEVSSVHIGTYSCNYYNFSGILVEIENMFVDIWVPPSSLQLALVENDSNSINGTTVSLQAGSDVSLTCSTVSRPASKITWNAPRWLKIGVSVVSNKVNHYITQINSTVLFTMTSKMHKEKISCQVHFGEDRKKQKQLEVLVRDPSPNLRLSLYGNRKEVWIKAWDELEIVAGSQYIVSCYVISKTLGGVLPKWKIPKRIVYDITTDSNGFIFHKDFSRYISRLHFKADWSMHKKDFKCTCEKSSVTFTISVEGFSQRRSYLSASLCIVLIITLIGISVAVRMCQLKRKTISKAKQENDGLRRKQHPGKIASRRSLPEVPWETHQERPEVEHGSFRSVSESTVYEGITQDCKTKDGIKSICYRDLEFGLEINTSMPIRWEGKLLFPKKQTDDIMISSVSDSSEPKFQLIWRNYIGVLHSLPSHCSLLQTLGICNSQDRFFVVHKYVRMVTLQFFLRSQHSKQSIDNTVILLLLELAKQIVDGLQFLALNECCHPGLSSKTILVDPRGNCKLYNFWLLNDASEVLEQYNLEEEHSVLTSLSPEALLIGEYVLASDVWSLGMTLWEVFSLGRNPYPGITVCKMKENLQNFKENKPTKPMIISDGIYAVLQSCWVQRVTKRSAVTEIKEKLKTATSSFLQERESFDTTHNALEDVYESEPLNEELSISSPELNRNIANGEEERDNNQYDRKFF